MVWISNNIASQPLKPMAKAKLPLNFVAFVYSANDSTQRRTGTNLDISVVPDKGSAMLMERYKIRV